MSGPRVEPWDELEAVSAVILAAGRGRRMAAASTAAQAGHCDKGLLPLGRSTMVGVLMQRLRPQVPHIAINATAASHADYARWGCPVFADDAAYVRDVSSDDASDGANDPGKRVKSTGPLAGIATALARCPTPWLLTLACDTPLIPLDLLARMAEVARRECALIVTAAGPEFSLASGTTGPVRTQPTVALVHRSVWADLDAFIRAGERKIDAWTARHPHAIAVFDRASDAPWTWANANTPQELAALQALWQRTQTRDGGAGHDGSEEADLGPKRLLD